MKVLAELARRVAKGERCALATVVKTEGSSPAQASMRMLVGTAGRLAGTVGGGRVEAEVERAARATLADGRARTLRFDLDDDLAEEGGLICGGTAHVLVERVEPPAPWAQRAVHLLATGGRGVLLARILEGVERELVEGEAALPHLASEQPRLEGDVFVEPLVRPRCLLLGAGHVGRSVARIAAEAGFGVSVVEDREAFARGLDADDVLHADLEQGLQQLSPGPDDYVVVTTRSHGMDLACVRAALRTPARYVGMLASRRKTAMVRAALAEEGIDAERLHAPIGLDLGALSAGEIAVSVVAQLVKVRRLGRGDR